MHKQGLLRSRQTPPMIARLMTAAVILGSTLALAGCDQSNSNALSPAGPAARDIATLWWLLLVMGTVIYVAVISYMLVALFRRTRSTSADATDGADAAAPVDTLAERQRARRGVRTIVIAGIILPALVLLVVFGATITTLRALGTPAIPPENVVKVTGNQWWWKVDYPAYLFETANEIHIPVGEPMQIILESNDVIHSFWVPELHGKLDLIPGRTNEFWIQADEAGVYDGVCAEFCGGPHALMRFIVVAKPAADYEAWLAGQQQPARVPTDPLAVEGLNVFLRKDCGDCHTLRGTDATGVLGPDLTHLASRRLLAAGAAPNNKGTMGGWILDPQHLKPGAFMPDTPMTGEELTALLAWLETLQ